MAAETPEEARRRLATERARAEGRRRAASDQETSLGDERLRASKTLALSSRGQEMRAPALLRLAEEAAGAAAAKTPPQRISEQNFLLRNLDLLSSARAAVPVKKVVRMQTKEPGSLLNRLNLRPNVQELFKIRPYQVGALVPKIRLYKVFLDDTSTPGKIVELKFNDHTTPVSIEDITKTKYGRGDGVGIQSFTVETQGTNPAEGALVRCTLSIFFQTWKCSRPPPLSTRMIIWN